MKKLILLVLVLCIGPAENTAIADFSFGTPTNLGHLINSPISDFTECVSADGLSLFFASNRSPGGYRDFDLWMATRPSTADDWGAPVHMGDTLNSRQNEWTPCLTADGLELYYAKGPWGNTDIVVSRRNSLSESWGPPENLGPMINSTTWEMGPSLTADGLELYFDSARAGSPDLYVSTRATTSDPWSPAMNLGTIVNSTYGNSLYGDQVASVSPDGLTLFFSSARPPGSASNLDIWMTTRATREDAWGVPVHLGLPVNDSSIDWSPCISADGAMLYFVSDRSGGVGGDSDFWQVPILPAVDFNSDYKVDIDDLIILIEHWDTDEPLCDIGPVPWGDGVVDVNDLEVLMGYWGQELDDPNFIAHWALDETEGMFAFDSVGNNDAFVVGNPVWQPEEGQINGALEFDGVNDVIIVNPMLNPEDGPFSVFAWIKGGAPGQVIISQQRGVNWLLVDVDGMLTTDLKDTSRNTTSLYSDTMITDGNWHRIGFVWDGSQWILYVDGVQVASDSQASLGGSTGGLVIGAGKGNQPGTFWSGMIDDVRIYDRVVVP